MANSKSAKKRIKIIIKKTLRNKIIKSQTRTAIRKVVSAAGASDKAAAQTALVSAIREIDRACAKGIYHKNNASRKKSRLSKLVNKISA